MTEDHADWSMLALAWSLYFAFSLTVASLFPIVGDVRHDLDLTYAQVGLVLGAWQVVYLVAAIPVGYLVDRFQPRVVLFVGALGVASSQLARSMSHDVVSLFLAVALLGLGGPVMSVGLPKVISEFFTGRHRATASGIYITGSHVGQMSALAATALLARALGDWRVVLRVYAIVVLVLAVIWLLYAKDVRRGTEAERPGFFAGVRHVAAVPGVWLVVAVGFAGFLGGHGYRSWLPEMLVAHGMSPTRAGVVSALPALFGLVGSIVVLHVGAGRHRRGTAVVLLIVVGVAMLGAAAADGPLVYVFVSVEGFCAAALMPLMMNSLMELPQLGASYMGAAAGLYFTVGELGGFAGPTLVGGAVTLTGSFVVGVAVLSLTMWLMVFAALRMPVPPPSAVRTRT